jgi:hypothetical protein
LLGLKDDNSFLKEKFDDAINEGIKKVVETRSD